MKGTYVDILTADLISRIERLEAQLGTPGTAKFADANAATTAPRTEYVAAEPSSRRDLLRYGAVALGAAAAAGMAASPVEAADGGPVVLGVQNTATNATGISATQQTALVVTTSDISAPAIYAGGAGSGVYAEASSPGGAGVEGWVYAGTAAGVRGNSNSPNGVGVLGRNAVGGNAVRAEISSSSTVSGIAMYALNYSTYTGGGPGAGGFAIYGLSAKGHGLVGATAAAGGAAVVGASNGVAGAYAAAFYGPVAVSGNLTVFGAKSAAVPHPDGSHRRLYCVESPESWFEDFGRATLVCGEALITIDRDFAAVVDPADYHVFLTGYDGAADLSVYDRTPQGFRVRAKSGNGESTFSWRVVAKRKDIAGPRFETIEIPKEPTLPDVPASVYEPSPSPPDLPRMGMPPRRPNRKP
jgi:hypothetical protein